MLGSEPPSGESFDVLGFCGMVPNHGVFGKDVTLGPTLHRFGDICGDCLDPLCDFFSHSLTIGTDSALHECLVWVDIGSGPCTDVADGEDKVLATADVA